MPVPILYKGHRIFEYEVATGRINIVEVVFEETSGNRQMARLAIREGCRYFQALNLKNAKRRIKKLGYKISEHGKETDKETGSEETDQTGEGHRGE